MPPGPPPPLDVFPPSVSATGFPPSASAISRSFVALAINRALITRAPSVETRESRDTLHDTPDYMIYARIYCIETEK